MLRGINVGGKNIIRMDDLRSLYEKLAFKYVTTYVQSGNVIFATDKGFSDLSAAKKIEKAVGKSFKLNVRVIVRTINEMEGIIAANPFLQKRGVKIDKLHVTFLSEKPDPSRTAELRNLQKPPDDFIIKGSEIYLHCPNGYGTTKLSNNFFEKELELSATTRNWKTVTTLATLARQK
jgi:uncharacterized protein (DUF1697 family)